MTERNDEKIAKLCGCAPEKIAEMRAEATRRAHDTLEEWAGRDGDVSPLLFVMELSHLMYHGLMACPKQHQFFELMKMFLLDLDVEKLAKDHALLVSGKSPEAGGEAASLTRH